MKMTPKSQCPLYWTVLLYLSRELLWSMRNCSECAPLTRYWCGMQIFGDTEWTEAWSKRREWPKTALSSPAVGDQVFEEAYRAKRCSWYVQKSRCAVPLRGEGRDGENITFDSATALHFWPVKQLSKTDWQNFLPQYPKPTRYLWFWQRTPPAQRFWAPPDLQLLLFLVSKCDRWTV